MSQPGWIFSPLSQVDLEINGEPVDIWMKLDDTGAAFFVEDVDEDLSWPTDDPVSLPWLTPPPSKLKNI